MIPPQLPRCQRSVKILDSNISDIEFVRSLKEPCILSKDFTSNFNFNIFLKEEINEFGMRPVDYEKFLNFFDANHEVSVEHLDHETKQKVQSRMSLKSFIELLPKGGDDQVYLKDWHAQKEFSIPSSLYYDHLPYFMKMDWINNEKWTASDDNPLKGDYRFFYFGAPGSNTLIHEDVFRSFSWSFNVTGFKYWLVLPRHKKTEFLEKYSNTINFRTIPNAIKEFELVEAIQKPGEIMIMPPGYIHQVLNLTECFSINHNTIGVFNIVTVYEELHERFRLVLKELEDQKKLRSERDFAETVEQVLDSDFRITKQTMLELVKLVYNDRQQILCDQITKLEYLPAALEFTKFWTHGNINYVESLLKIDCKCVDKSKHLLSSNPCSEFIKQMKVVDFYFSQMIINKILCSL